MKPKIINLCFCILFPLYFFAQTITDCNNWANFTTRTTRGISIGNVAITGQHLTVEAEINPSVQYTLTSSGDIVSKHAWPSDCNYLLRPDRGQITLANGVHYSTPPICPTLQGKTYHVAMTYDGTELVFYRNGVRMSSITCSGNLIQNNWNTVIGTVATQNTVAESFVGYINEVRIWNIARTLEQIADNMAKPLQSPTTQTGLLAYYRFNSLKNIQGNTAFDGSLSEAIVYPSQVPSCQLADNSCPSETCQSYAKIDGLNNGFRAGNIDITGNQLTIEANVNSSGPYQGTNSIISQDIVSKHLNPNDVNYLLRLNHAEITTTSGFYKTDDVCDLTFGLTYHIAMVYDGINLKFYRNGQLMSLKACSGNMILNNWVTTIGAFAAQQFDPSITLQPNATFRGYINEVRIWKVARTQNQLNQFKDQQLTTPSTQTGLLAYYQFNDLKNKQGNAAYDLRLLGNPQINQTNPSCELGKDPCPTCNLTSSFDVKPDICDPAHFEFSNTTANVTNYLWTFGDNSISSVTTPDASVKYQNAGDYTISLNVFDNNGCSATTSKIVSASLIPNIIQTSPTDVCKGQNITLESTVDEVGTKYLWTPFPQLSNSDTKSVLATMDETTTFHLSVEKPNGCSYEDEVLITVPDAAKFGINILDTSICINNNVTLTGIGGDTYQWKDEEGNIIGAEASITVNPTDTSSYTVDVSNAKCAELATFNTVINVFPIVHFSITPSNDINCSNTSAKLSVKDAKNIVWAPNEYLISNGDIALITPKTTSTYTANVNDQYGCPYEVNYTQNVAFDPSSVHFFVPNAFTPNGDGKNDFFRIRTDVAMNRFSLRIFNRYGQLVFTSQNQKQGWNGRLKNELQPSGTYIFEVIGSSPFCGEYYKKGTVVLIR